MQDCFLRAKLVEEASWIDPVYEKASDFVHLSFRSLFSSIYYLDDDTRMIAFAITSEDQTTDESDYFEICDAFFDVTKLTGTFILAILMGRHQGVRTGPQRGRVPRKSKSTALLRQGPYLIPLSDSHRLPTGMLN
jgi:hypothetical protein